MYAKQLLATGLIAGLGAVAVPTVHAQPGWYLGASAGQADLDVGGFDESTTWKGFVGLQLNDWFAVEGGYVDMGEFDADVGNAGVEVSGPELQAIGQVPIGQGFALLGKVGVFNWDSEGTGALSGQDDDGTDAKYGVGAQYDFGNQWAVRGEFERYTNVADEDADVISLSVVFGLPR